MISQSKKDVWLSYKLHCEQIGRRVVQLSKWRTFWPENVHTVSKGESHQQLVVRDECVRYMTVDTFHHDYHVIIASAFSLLTMSPFLLVDASVSNAQSFDSTSYIASRRSFIDWTRIYGVRFHLELAIVHHGLYHDDIQRINL